MTVSSDFRTGLGLGLLLAAILSALLFSFGEGQRTRFRELKGRYEVLAERAEVLRDQYQRHGEIHRAEVARLEARLAALSAERDSLRRLAATLRVRLPALDSVARADAACWARCRPAVEARDSIIEMREAELAAADGELEQQAALRRELEARLSTADSVIAAETTARRAATSVIAVAAPKTNLWQWITRPKLGPAVFAGVCTTGQPCAGAGLSLNWSF